MKPRDATSVQDSVRSALDHGKHPGTILYESTMDAVTGAGQELERGELLSPETLVTARAMTQGLAVVRPLLARNWVHSIGKVTIGIERSDQHVVRVGQVAMTLERTGLETVDRGSDSPRAKSAEAARADRGLLAAISALLPTMPSMLATKGMMATVGFGGRLGPVSDARPRQQPLPARSAPTRAC